MNDRMAKLQEECGVFGVFGQTDAALLTYQGLHALQHRGQEGAGIAAADGESIRCVKGRGLLAEAVSSRAMEELTGKNSIGHVRYSTAGGSERENIQPILARGYMGTLAVAHNGQIVNAPELRRQLENQGSIFSGSSDSEIILHLIQREKGSLLQKIQTACRRLEGAFAFLIMTEKNLYAVRDRHGLRPLAAARLGQGFCVGSESCAFDLVDASFWRDVQPGEILKFSAQGVSSYFYTQDTEQRLCAMEYIYFSRPDSNVDGQNVHAVRKETGRCLARKDKGILQADMVVGDRLSSTYFTENKRPFHNLGNGLVRASINHLFGSDIKNVMIVIGVTTWSSNAKLMRAQALSLRERTFVKSAIALGETKMQVLFKYILPNGIFPVVANTTRGMAGAILTEASLSFLGLGDPNTISWGQMIYQGKSYVTSAWWITGFAGIAIILTVIVFYLLGDGLNHVLNPKYSQGGKH